MNQELPLRIILEKPPAGVDFGIQKGSGSSYETILTQRSGTKNILFEFKISVKEIKESAFAFLGPIVQGPTHERFIYIDIGTAAGQAVSAWSRRLKIPLRDISSETIRILLTDPGKVLETTITGTAKDKGPNCGTVKPFAGWHVSEFAK